MEQIISISIKNFRSLSDNTWFNIAPITVLTGTNSSGKSSFTKLLQFLKTNADKIISQQQLSYTSNNLGLQSFDTTKNNKTNEDEIVFTINHDMDPGFDGVNYFSFLMNYYTVRIDKNGIKEIKISNFLQGDDECPSENDVEAKLIVEQKKNKESRQLSDVRLELDFIKIFKTAIQLSKIDGTLGSFEVIDNYDFEEIFSNVVRKKISHLNKKDKEDLLNAFISESLRNPNNLTGKPSTPEDIGSENLSNKIFLFQHEIESGFPIETIDKIMKRFNVGDFFKGIKVEKYDTRQQIFFPCYPIFSKKKMFILTNFINDLSYHIESAKNIFTKIFYLPANRHFQKRFIDVVKSESYFEALLSQSELFRNKEKWQYSEARQDMIRWLKAFELAEDFDYDIIRDSLIELRFMKADRKWYNLTELGYGYTQIIPIIISCLLISFESFALFNNGDKIRNDGDRIIIVEEPETNLHPGLQSKLADFFHYISTIADTRLIIETHSEYLIRKLQYLTMKEELKPKDSQIYYFYNPDKVPEGEPQVKPININKDGSLTDDFGTGFFDEADKIAMSIWSMNNAKKN